MNANLLLFNCFWEIILGHLQGLKTVGWFCYKTSTAIRSFFLTQQKEFFFYKYSKILYNHPKISSQTTWKTINVEKNSTFLDYLPTSSCQRSLWMPLAARKSVLGQTTVGGSGHFLSCHPFLVKPPCCGYFYQFKLILSSHTINQICSTLLIR